MERLTGMSKSIRFGWTTLVGWALALAIGTAAAADDPIVIAHRGASGYLPEHTLESYALAFGLGADYIEPDLIMSKDGVLFCLHDIHLEATTNVEEVFPSRKRADGRWYGADFTIAEIKMLSAHERMAGRFPVGKSQFEVPTFDEMIELIQGLNVRTGRNVGLYPELKAPSWHAREGLPLEAAVLETLSRYGYRGKDARVFVQCFESGPLKAMRKDLGSELPQIMLIGGGGDSGAMLTKEGLREIATFADGIGPSKSALVKNPSIVEWAHAAGLKVHPYTMRADQVPKDLVTHEEELARYYAEYEVDGVFTDFPDRARRYLDGAKQASSDATRD